MGLFHSSIALHSGLFAASALALTLFPMNTSAQQAPSLQVSQQASVSAPLIKNGDFQNWNNGILEDWSADVGTELSPDESMAYDRPSALRMRRVESQPQKAAALIYQDVVLKPDTEYLLSGWVVKGSSGAFIFRVQPASQGRILQGQESALDQAIHSAIMPWYPVKIPFRTGKHSGYRLSILDFSGIGSPAWVSSVSLVEVGKTAGDDRRDSHVVFSRSTMQPFDERRRPLADEVLQEVVSFGTRGDFSPALVGLHAFEDLQGVHLRLKGDLESAGGGVGIPASAIEVRMTAEQSLLPLSRPRELKAGRNAGWWVTVKVPETAKAGRYRGMLEVVSGQRVLSEIPYQLIVEAFRLPEPKATFAAYHAEAYIPAGYLSAPLRKAYYRDMKEHGMNSATVYNTPDVDGSKVDFSREHRMNAITGEKREKELTRNHWTEEEIGDRAGWGLDKVMPMMMETGLVQKERPVLWLPLKLGGYTFGDMPSAALKHSVKEWKSRSEWPEPLLYVIDEPAEIPERIEHARKVLNRMETLDLNVRKVTANVDIEELGSLYNVWIMGADRITQDLKRKAREEGKELWAYACNIPADNNQFSRAMFGFWAYRTGIDGVAIWAYYDARNWYADEKGVIHGKNGRVHLSRVCLSPDGPIPTTSWEATREGVTDYRYAQLFDSLIEEAKSRIAELKKAGDTLPEEARKALESRDGTWNPSGTTEKEVAERYQAALTLEANLKPVLGWRTKLIESIPFDAMAPLKNTPVTVYNYWVPALGAGNVELVSEDKRNSVRAYVRYLSSLLEATR